VLAPCGLILENWNFEKMQHVMQKKMDLKNVNKKQLQKEHARKENINAQTMQMQKRNAKQIKIKNKEYCIL